MDAADLVHRLLEEAELRQHALSCPAHVVRHLALDPEQLHEAARLLEHSTGPHGDAARAVLFALLATTPSSENRRGQYERSCYVVNRECV